MILEFIKYLLVLVGRTVGAETGEAIDAHDPVVPTTPVADTNSIFRAMAKHGYKTFRNPGEINIVYIEGMNPDFTKNDNHHNEWNDLRLVLDDTGRILGSWRATVNPGDHYVYNSIADDGRGAANTSYGQYTAWQVGMHRGNHEALIQTGGMVTVDRDDNKNFERDDGNPTTGYYGINQHWGYDMDTPNTASAGCLVGQTKSGHREFMKFVKSDVRYQANKEFVFTSCILSNEDF